MVYLENTDTAGDLAVLRLDLEMGLVTGADVALAGNEEAAALLLIAHQKGVYSNGESIKAYAGSRGMELNYLRAFLENAVAGDNPSEAQQYLPRPAAEMLASAEAEWDKVGHVLSFSQDKAGVYQRLTSEEKSAFIERIYREGELAAFVWAEQVRPDIFWSVDFKPQGYGKDAWRELVGR